MPEALSRAASAARPKWGSRDEGKDRTSATAPMSAAASNLSNLGRSWVEWPMVQTAVNFDPFLRLAMYHTAHMLSMATH